MRIKVVEVNGQKFFEYDGLRFNYTIYVYSLFAPEDKVKIEIFRRGELIDQGTIDYVKNMHGRKEKEFCGFVNEYFNSSGIGLNNELEFGDEIVFTAEKGLDYKNLLIEAYLIHLSIAEKKELIRLFPYPLDQRKTRKFVNNVFEQKKEHVRGKIEKGEISFLNYYPNEPDHPREPTQYEIMVVAETGELRFEYEGMKFNLVPLFPEFYNELKCIDQAKFQVVRDGAVYCEGGISEVGTHGASVMFNSWDEKTQVFFGNYFCASNLHARFFQENDRLILHLPFKFDLRMALALHSSQLRKTFSESSRYERVRRAALDKADDRLGLAYRDLAICSMLSSYEVIMDAVKSNQAKEIFIKS